MNTLRLRWQGVFALLSSLTVATGTAQKVSTQNSDGQPKYPAKTSSVQRLIRIEARLPGRRVYRAPSQYCGQDDPSDDSGNEKYRWPAESFPIKVYIAPGDCDTGYRSSFRTYLVEAFNTWAEASNHKVGWQLVSDRSKADLICSWVGELPMIATGQEAGRTRLTTRFNTETNEGMIHHGTMDLLTINTDGRPFSDAEMRRICLHEAGHAYGLEYHSPHHDDIMYRAVSPTQPCVLSQRDVANINDLYSSYPCCEISKANSGDSVPHS